MEGKMTERPIPYSQILPNIQGHEISSERDILEAEAVDLMSDSIRLDPEFMELLRQRDLTVGDERRLTERWMPKDDNLDYAKDLLWRVHNPTDLILAISQHGFP